jgi:hypothetical protein
MIDYEWIVETYHAHGDVTSVRHYTSAVTAVAVSRECPGSAIVLVRSEWDRERMDCDRSWAYVANGLLPSHFSDAAGELTGYRVPDKYHAALRRANL